MSTGKQLARRLAVICLAFTPIRGQQADTDSKVIVPPKVEFVEVNGRECLQPVVNGVRAKLEDYQAAEARWLESRYPGMSIRRSESVLHLPPEDSDADEARRTTVVSRTVHLESIVGQESAVCFDINLVTDLGNDHSNLEPSQK